MRTFALILHVPRTATIMLCRYVHDVNTHGDIESSWNSAIMSALVRTGNAGGDDTIAAVEDFRPGNTLHYWGVTDM